MPWGFLKSKRQLFLKRASQFMFDQIFFSQIEFWEEVKEDGAVEGKLPPPGYQHLERVNKSLSSGHFWFMD